MKLFYVFNDFKRSTSGALANYGRKNIIRAYADTKILKNDLTKGVPVLRDGGADFKNNQNAPELARFRQMAERRQAFTGNLSPSPGTAAPQAAAQPADPDAEFIGNVADQHMRNRNML